MWNLKKNKTAQVAAYEKYIREENIGPKADENQPIWEKTLPHRDGNKYTTTEHQMKSEHKIGDTEEAKVIEKVLNATKDFNYVQHRSDASSLSVPPIAALVEKMRQERLSNDYKPVKKSHWTITMKDKKQNGSLPKWPKMAPQHGKPVLNNDPDRFTGMNHMPTSTDQLENASARSKSKTIVPLTGDITTADIDRVNDRIRTGKAMDYDSAITAICREADARQTELTMVEQKTISDLKIARTKAMLK